MSSPKYFNLNYEERPYEEAQAKYGVGYRRATVEAGQKVYRLVKLQEKTGHSSLITQVLDENGQPMPDVRVPFYWPDAPDFPFPSEHDWYKNFEVGLTNLNGEVGPGMGKGAYFGEGDPNGGPHKVWIHDPDVPSDIVENLGMIAGTFHDHLDQVFQLVVAGSAQDPAANGGPSPEPPSPPTPPIPPEPPPEPEPEPGGWTMTEERFPAPGLRLIIGRMPYAGIAITVMDPWGNTIHTTSGAKGGYGIGGWEVALSHAALYTISFLGLSFQAQVDNNTAVNLFFEEGPAPEPEPPFEEARLVTSWMPSAEAEALLLALALQYPAVVFYLECPEIPRA